MGVAEYGGTVASGYSIKVLYFEKGYKAGYENTACLICDTDVASDNTDVVGIFWHATEAWGW